MPTVRYFKSQRREWDFQVVRKALVQLKQKPRLKQKRFKRGWYGQVAEVELIPKQSWEEQRNLREKGDN